MTEDNQLIGLTDQARMMMLFDAAAECAADVALFERDEPEAPTALALWASSRHLPSERRGGVECPLISVATSKHRSICVYLRAVAA